jgi:succinate dehydrogenase / fumarate reductase cytochrome b subunit
MAVPIPQKSPVARVVQAWFNPLKRSAGFLAFVLMRITGIGLVVYLLLHMVVIGNLLRGPAGWDSLIQTMKSPWVLALDVLLIAGILIHMLNGLRVTIIGLGFGTQSHKGIFWTLMAVALLLLVYSGWLVFTK